MNNAIIRGLRVTVTTPPPAPVSSPPIADNSSNPCLPASCLDFISSDETLDRYDEIICASGWKLDSYLRNPVFQNSHQYGDILHTLGRALMTEVRSPVVPSSCSPFLFQRIEFAVDANPIARLAYKLYSGGFLRAVSVGFTPIRWQEGTADSTFRRKYFEQELLEVSAVSLPANPNALALALKSGAVDKSDLHDLVDLCSLSLPASTSQPGIATAHLASLARLASTLLKH